MSTEKGYVRGRGIRTLEVIPSFSALIFPETSLNTFEPRESYDMLQRVLQISA